MPEEAPGLAPFWRSFGTAKTSLSTEGPLNGRQCMKVESQGTLSGLSQRPLRIRSGEVYRGSLWARGEAAGGLSVRLTSGRKILAEQALPAPPAEWQQLPVELKAAASSDSAALEVAVRGSGTVWIDHAGKGYSFRWQIGSQSYRGTASKSGDVVTVDWGDTHPVFYLVIPDCELHGTWADGRALEKLTPWK